MYRAVYTFIHTHQIVTAVGVFSYKSKFLRGKSKVLQPCTVYIY